jgi:hypothetical protein
LIGEVEPRNVRRPELVRTLTQLRQVPLRAMIDELE